MNAEESLRETFERDGYVVARGFLTAEQLSSLWQNVQRYLREVVPGLPATDVFYQGDPSPESVRQLHRLEQDAFFEGLQTDSKWVDFATRLLGEPVVPEGAEWFNKLPGGHATPPHQDNRYFLLQPPRVVTLWLAMADVDEENGALRYVAGSHRHGPRRHAVTDTQGFSQQVIDYGPNDERQERLVCLAPGDLVAHYGETIHRADANRSADRRRPAFAMVFRGESCRRDEAARHAYQQALQSQQRPTRPTTPAPLF